MGERLLPPFLIKERTMKTYKAKTLMSINVVLRNGRNKFLMFDQLSDGTSLLRVNDPMVAEAVERDVEFGKNFYLYKDDGKMRVEPKADALGTGAEREEKSPTNRTNEGEETEEPEAKPQGTVVETPATPTTPGEKKEVTFASMMDARDWLNEKFGVAKKSLMSKESIVNCGEERGYKIVVEE